MAEMLDHFLDQGAQVGVILCNQDSNWGPPASEGAARVPQPGREAYN
jgi:hypothetical protein